jgi:prolyl-tRNA synthetase
VQRLLTTVTTSILKRAEKELRSRIIVAQNTDEAVQAVSNGIAMIPWCGERRCADFLEEKTGASILGTFIKSALVEGEDGLCPACGREGSCTVIGRTF